MTHKPEWSLFVKIPETGVSYGYLHRGGRTRGFDSLGWRRHHAMPHDGPVLLNRAYPLPVIAMDQFLLNVGTTGAVVALFCTHGTPFGSRLGSGC
jgi:hypothetical protein